MIISGIDIGSTTAKAVLMDENERILAATIRKSGFDPELVSELVLQECCDKIGCKKEDVVYCISTGYGRDQVREANEKLTEITCHGRGAHVAFPQARGVIDIGGQDSKAIVIDENGYVDNFAMNDKCAAGTGRFLDVMANIMEITTEEMGYLSLKAQNDLIISSICTVFAESEVISLISQKKNPYDIMAGIHSSVTRRVGTLVERVKLPKPIVITGGVGKNVGIIASFEKMLGTALLVPEEPQLIGAVGAASIALRKYKKQIGG